MVLQVLSLCLREQPDAIPSNDLLLLFEKCHEVACMFGKDAFKECLLPMTGQLARRLQKRDKEVIAQLGRLFKIYYKSHELLSQFFLDALEQVQADVASPSVEQLEFLYYFGRDVSRFTSTRS